MTVSLDDVAGWPSKTLKEVLDHLAALVSELGGLYQEQAMLEATETKEKVEGWLSSPEPGSSARDRAARAQALTATMALTEVRGRIMALENYKAFGFLLVEKAVN